MDPVQDNLRRDRPMMSATTTISAISRARSGTAADDADGADANTAFLFG